MSLLLVDIRQLICNLDLPTKDISLDHIKFGYETVSQFHTIIATNGNEFKILKDRHGHSNVNKVYPIQALIFFIYRYQSDMVETGSVNAADWIVELTRFLTSEELATMSKTLEKLAFEKA